MAGIRLLLVDDDEMVREAVRDFFVDCGAIVVTAESARAALAAFRASPPDVLVSDLRMPPGEDGFWLMSAVRGLTRAEGNDVPAVAITGDMQAASRAIAAGFQAVHGKPPRLTELASLVASLAAKNAA